MTSVSDRPDSLDQADPNSSTYWLIVGGGEFAPEVFTTEMAEGERALVVFGFREEGEMYLRSREGLDAGGWRPYQGEAGEVLSVLWGLCRDVRYVMIDPLPESLPQRLVPSTNVMGRQQFMEFVMGRRSLERKLEG